MDRKMLKITFGLLFVCVLTQQATQMQPRVKVGSRFANKYDEALEAIFSVAIRLEGLLTDTNMKTSKNFLVSPLSMAVAVGELMLGASGPLREQLHELLTIEGTNHSSSVRHINVDDTDHLGLHEQLGDLMQNLQQAGQAYTLKTASVLFAQKNLRIKKEFRDNVLKFYGTKLQELDFEKDPLGCEKIVNAWVTECTNGLITELLPGPLPTTTRAILANAVYFKGDWEIPFASEINRQGVFKVSSNTTVNVTYMIGEFDNYRYVDSKRLKCRMVVIPYENEEVSMYIIMPTVNEGKEFDINDFVGNLRTKDVSELIDSTKVRKVTMILPKMSLSNTVSMIEPLKRYHKYKNTTSRVDNFIDKDDVDALEDKVRIFGNLSALTRRDNVNLDLSNISDDPRFQISNVYQQMTLSVNEKGTEAAAIAAGIVDYILDSVVFKVDRPFLFFIRHERTEASLFWGTIVDPMENNEL